MNITFGITGEHSACRLCGHIESTEIVLTDIIGNSKEIKLCEECEYKVYDALRERQMQRIIHGYASNE